MSLPEVLQRELGDEDPVTRVHLGGDDELFVTPTRTVIYRAEGLLSDESVETYPHDAERIEVSEGRRKSKLTLDYGLDGEQTIALPGDALDQVLHPVIAGVLSAAGVTEPGETVERTFRFSELTLIVTNQRVVKHVGTAVWDEDFEQYDFDQVTDLVFEDGEVNTTIVLTENGRQERFKTPNEDARPVKEALADALLSYYEVDTLTEFREAATVEPGDDAGADEENDVDVSFGEGVDPLGTQTSESDADGETDEFDPEAAVAETTDGGATTDDAFADSEFEPANPEEDLAEEVERLREAVERQEAELTRQADLIEQLIEELRRGR